MPTVAIGSLTSFTNINEAAAPINTSSNLKPPGKPLTVLKPVLS